MDVDKKKVVRITPVLKAYAKASLRYPGLLWSTILGTFGIQAAAIIAPLYLKDFINIIASADVTTAVSAALFGILVSYALVVAAGWVARMIQMDSVNRIESRTMKDLSSTAFEYLIRHSHNFFISNFAGTLTRRVTRYARAYEQVFDSMVQNFLPTVFFAIGSIAVLSMRNVWLGLALSAWVIIFVVLQVVLTRWQHPLRVKRAAEDSRMTGALADAIGNHSTIGLFAAEPFEERRFGAVVSDWSTATRRSWLAGNWVQSIQGAFAIVVEIGLLGGAVLLWQQGELTVGDFVLIQTYILGLIDRIWDIGGMLRRLYDAFADASEMLDILETPHDIIDATNAPALHTREGEIVFNGVTFSFSHERTILENLSLTIRGHEKVALVGPSGAGKTTITKLLLRLYDPISGRITIDGQDIGGVTQESLRHMISFVPQEPVLFHRTLHDNIRYGKQDATEEEIIAAAKRAHCHEFISSLPQGYETYVGERGVKLSGGERQRIAIARAILKNAPILILDEATSSLDSESEALIQDALAKLMEGKTVIAIAHRLSTIMKMDRIIVMEKGKVMLSGSHDELLSRGNNLYKKLWEIQAGGFLAGAEDDEA